jgi:hypothetical protein
MSHGIHEHANPICALGEPKAEGSGMARVVAEPNHDGLLNPIRCWGSVRRKSAGRPARTSVARDFAHALRRQRTGRVGQSSSSEFNSSRGGLVGFPTGNASRRDVSSKAGVVEQARHRASSSKSR